MNNNIRDFAVMELSSSAVTKGYIVKCASTGFPTVITAVSDPVFGVALETLTEGEVGSFNVLGCPQTFLGKMAVIAPVGSQLYPASDGRFTTASAGVTWVSLMSGSAAPATGTTATYALRPLAVQLEASTTANDLVEIVWA